ncbi:XdhC family protein [Paraglaciecola sp. MB-3u-78]|jgi:xanthine dehydrogenase accessory factor|uniref:XdhC family protein n=1 Tax=Paraglaciecola sp. MB-3u-78 TaxID=2058332 RepID=UPI000C33E4BD|nr:XdhC/CoxI family protein [Paraglaciecola sp. MB-3u-78]PKG99657.1 xanthine dehydrogenase [Paraglaciecola sp. MB-3u-78]
MANRISQLLDHWSQKRDKHLWVLATIIETDGSSYRKAGAMMLINDMGQYFGLLSGGCLESDIMRQARRCWDNQRNRIIEYDMREEEDLAWQLGIGCGGMVRILLQPVHANNDYLKLDALNSYLEQRQKAEYHQQIDEGIPSNKVLPIDEKSQTLGTSAQVTGSANVFVQLLSPAPLLAVFGAGVDAKPLVSIAAELGWQVLLIDPRVGYAKAEFFTKANQIIRQSLDDLYGTTWLSQIDAALVLTHNIKLDAAALKLVQSSSAKYVGLLGPTHRTDRVLDIAKLTRNDLSKPLANPVGLRLGGELPESIALSMLAEVHAVLENADGLSISGVLNQ